MKTLLHIKSSLFGDAGKSSALAEQLITRWKTENPASTVVVRDIISDALPALTPEVIGALMSQPDQRSPEQAALVALSDTLINEIKHADALVIGVPMYNFGVPSQLKSYFDLLARAGITFRYTDTGPVGLLDDKPVYLLATRGGLYHDNGVDFQIPFVKQFLNFIGLTRIETLYAEGLNMGEIGSQALANAGEKIKQLAL